MVHSNVNKGSESSDFWANSSLITRQSVHWVESWINQCQSNLFFVVFRQTLWRHDFNGSQELVDFVWWRQDVINVMEDLILLWQETIRNGSESSLNLGLAFGIFNPVICTVKLPDWISWQFLESFDDKIFSGTNLIVVIIDIIQHVKANGLNSLLEFSLLHHVGIFVKYFLTPLFKQDNNVTEHSISFNSSGFWDVLAETKLRSSYHALVIDENLVDIS